MLGRSLLYCAPPRTCGNIDRLSFADSDREHWWDCSKSDNSLPENPGSILCPDEGECSDQICCRGPPHPREEGRWGKYYWVPTTLIGVVVLCVIYYFFHEQIGRLWGWLTNRPNNMQNIEGIEGIENPLEQQVDQPALGVDVGGE